MSNYLPCIISAIISFIIVVILMPITIPLFHKLKFGQTEREEGLASHKAKNGTPTMGGLIFIIATFISAIIINFKNLNTSSFWILTMILIGYAGIGFWDDYLIIKKHNNKGISPKLKFGLQSLLAILFCISSSYLIPTFSTTITLFGQTLDLHWFYYVVVYFMFTATSNGVNLSDGLDGLSSGLSIFAVLAYAMIAIASKDFITYTYAFALIGGLLGFLVFNKHPAKIFMGDVGSLSIGGFLAALAVLTKQELLLIIIGGVFVIETLSVILQVISFKTTGKRIFKMSPIHHHFELSGWSETKIVIIFWICGIIFMGLGLLIFF